MKSTGARWAFISFPSGGERIAALLGGHVDMMIVDPSEARRAGARRQAARDRAGERAAAARLPGRADLKEAGFDIPNVPQMRGVVGAPGMPAERSPTTRICSSRSSKTPAWQKFLTESQLDGEFVGTAELKAFLATFEGQLRDILKEAGAKVVR